MKKVMKKMLLALMVILALACAMTAGVQTAKAATICTVTFDSDGGSSVSPISGIASGSTITLPVPPTLYGYSFRGWFTEKDGQGTQLLNTTPINQSMTVYADWARILKAPVPDLDVDYQNKRIIATWSAIGHATAYQVQLLNDETTPKLPLCDPITVTNGLMQDFTELIVSNYKSCLTYRVNVKAVGDGKNYADSEWNDNRTGYFFRFTVAPTDVAAYPSTATVGQNSTLVFTTSSKRTDYKPSWSISKNDTGETEATISDGDFTAKKAGVATVTLALQYEAFYGNETYSEDFQIIVGPAKLKTPNNLNWKLTQANTYTQVGTWDAVENASSYLVQLYQNNVKEGDPISVSDGASYDFSSDLKVSGYYSFAVQAIGDQVSYLDSDWSQQGYYQQYTVPSAPAFVTQPTDMADTEGKQPTYFKAVASGYPAPTYQWQVSKDQGASWSNVTDGNAITSSGYAYYAPPVLTMAMNGYQYRCVATNGVSQDAISNAAKLTVNPIPVITFDTQPAALTELTVRISPNHNYLTAAASVKPSGYAQLQWYDSDENGKVYGACQSGSRFLIPMTEGTYYYICRATCTGAQPVTSTVAKVVVYPAPPIPTITFTTQPVSETTLTAGIDSLTVNLTAAAEVSDGGEATLSWHQCDANGMNMSNSIGTGGAFTATTSQTNGTIYYVCVATYPWAADVKSNIAKITLKVIPTIEFFIQPNSGTVTEGSITEYLTAAAQVSPSGTETLNWYACNASGVISGNSVGKGNTFYIPTSLKEGTYYYLCQATCEGAQAVNSSVATITVNPAPVAPTITFTTQPTDKTVTAGSIAGMLTATATMSDDKIPNQYWYACDASGKIAGESLWLGVTFDIPKDLTAGDHYFLCQATHWSAATVNSNVVKVTVNAAPVVPTISFTKQPTNTTVTEGSITGNLTAEASVSPSGTATLNWYHCTSDGSGMEESLGTGGTFAIPTFLSAGKHHYICQATYEGAKSVYSNVVTVTVNASSEPLTISFTTQPASETTVTAGSIEGILTAAAKVSNGDQATLFWYPCDPSGKITGNMLTMDGMFAIPTTLAEGTYYYLCQATYPGVESVNANVAKVTVSSASTSVPPTITFTTQPVAATVTAGSITGNLTAAASVSNNGTAALNWYACNASGEISGSSLAAGGIFAIPKALAEGTYYYLCQATSAGAETVNSNVAKVTVTSAPVAPTITFTTQPIPATVTAGSITGNLTAAASVSNGDIAVLKWYACNASGEISGSSLATGGIFAIPTTLSEGTYYYLCQATYDGAKSVNSNVAKITVNSASISTYSIALCITKDGSAYSGLQMTLQTAGGTTYQMPEGASGTYVNTAIPNGTYTIYKGGISTGKRFEVRDAADTILLEYFTVSFNANGGAPAPDVQIVLKNDSVSAPVAMTKGTDVFGGWYSDSAFNTTWNFSGSKVVAKTILHAKWTSIGAAPAIITQPQDQYVVVGQKATFTIAATGSGLTYQWYINRNDGQGWLPLNGKTGTSYTTTAAKLNNDGYQYRCDVTGTTRSTLHSDVAVLHVREAQIPPKTGDDSPLILWLSLYLLGGLGLMLTMRRKHNN